MSAGRRAAMLATTLLLAALAAPALAATAPTPTIAESFSLKPLSSADARAWSRAFAAARAGRFEEARALAAGAADTALMGRLEFVRLMHPSYAATYEELAGWLEQYRDQPDAERIYALAKKRQPAAARIAAPAPPAGADAAIWARVEAQAQRLQSKSAPALAAPATAAAPSADQTAAREAYYAGEVERAYALANRSDEAWIAGLAAFRLKRYDEARARFESLATDTSRDEWIRSAGAYWAARAAIASGAAEAAPAYLNLAARTPYTFYGLIAERQLGLEPAIDADGMDPAMAEPERPLKIAAVTGAGGAELAALVRSDPRARRAAAFAQLGMKPEASAELRSGLAAAPAASRNAWAQLGLSLNVGPGPTGSRPRGLRPRFDIAQFPTPELSPDGGFTQDKALVYALVRQESRFNAGAVGGGAYGLMQITPSTAARVSGDDKLRKDPARLKDAGFNLRLGQDYIGRLLGSVNGDLLHTVAAYNLGPGALQKALERTGRNLDSLLAIESIPGAQTRDFVEKVVASYWIYRNIFGLDSPTLDAAASSLKAIPAKLDQESAGKTSADAQAPKRERLAGLPAFRAP